MIRSVAIGLAATLLGVACGSDGDTSERDRAVAIYQDMIRTAVGTDPFRDLDDPEALTVMVFPLDENEGIPLDVQIDVLVALDGYATVRFVDTFEEAVDEDQPGSPARDGGVAIGLASIPDASATDSSQTVRAARYEDADSVAGLIFEIRAEGSSWSAEVSGNYVPSLGERT